METKKAKVRTQHAWISTEGYDRYKISLIIGTMGILILREGAHKKL